MPFQLEFVEFQVFQRWLNSCEAHAGKQRECTPKNTEVPGRHTNYCTLIKITTITSSEMSIDTIYLFDLSLNTKEKLKEHNCEESH